MKPGTPTRGPPSGKRAGLGLALGLARFMAALVFGIQPRDPVTFVVVPLLLLGIAAFATMIPARRAVHVDPVTALRDE